MVFARKVGYRSLVTMLLAIKLHWVRGFPLPLMTPDGVTSGISTGKTGDFIRRFPEKWLHGLSRDFPSPPHFCRGWVFSFVSRWKISSRTLWESMIFTVPTQKASGRISALSEFRFIELLILWSPGCPNDIVPFPARHWGFQLVMGVAPDGMGYSYDLGKPFKNLLLIIDHISTVINHIYQRSFNHQ